MTRRNLIAILGRIQNSPAHINVDIMTFAGLLSTEELVDYVLTKFRALGDPVRAANVLAFARDIKVAS